MPCACDQCLQHSRTLNITEGPESKDAIRKAYHAAAKLWHPDRFQHDPVLQITAEENFKTIQAAYTELNEHFENPVRHFTEPVAAEPPVEDFFAPHHTRINPEPRINFSGAHGCYVAPDFPPRAFEIISSHVREPDRAVALVDLSRHGSAHGDLSQYILFSAHGIYIRDAQGILSLLWYDDLGETRFVDQRKNGKLPLQLRFVEKISGTEQKYSLEIYRRDGTLFYAIASQADDGVKKVIYNFLQQKKPQPHP
jgi:hypothetical protein